MCLVLFGTNCLREPRAPLVYAMGYCWCAGHVVRTSLVMWGTNCRIEPRAPLVYALGYCWCAGNVCVNVSGSLGNQLPQRASRSAGL